MEAKVKAQTAPNKDVQREIADLGEVGMASLCLFLPVFLNSLFLYLLCFLKTESYSIAQTSLNHTIPLRLATDSQLSSGLSMSLQNEPHVGDWGWWGVVKFFV
jgi:hypothetical protein